MTNGKAWPACACFGASPRTGRRRPRRRGCSAAAMSAGVKALPACSPSRGRGQPATVGPWLSAATRRAVQGSASRCTGGGTGSRCATGRLALHLAARSAGPDGGSTSAPSHRQHADLPRLWLPFPRLARRGANEDQNLRGNPVPVRITAREPDPDWFGERRGMESRRGGAGPLPLATAARQGCVGWRLPRRGRPRLRPCPASVSRLAGGIQAEDSGR